MNRSQQHGAVFRWPIFILFLTFVAELIGGILFGALSLIGDSVHVISDIVSLLIAFTAITIAHKKQPNNRFVHGYHRLEVLSALFNGLLLVGIAVYLVTEALHRFQTPSSVDAQSALWIGILGLVVNLSVLAFFHSSLEHQDDINVKGALWHILGDSLASISVIFGMVAIMLTGNPIWDPIITIFISLLILYGSGRVLLEGTQILMHKSPQELSKILHSILQQEHIISVEGLRLWQVCSHLTVGTAHIVTDLSQLSETAEVSKIIKKNLKKQFGIRQITFEFETPETAQRHSHNFDHEHKYEKE